MVEYLDIIDENDNVIDVMEKEEAHVKKLKRRFVHIYLFNDSGEMLIQQRSETKGWKPNLIDPSAAGHVQSGEAYEDAAHRELMEEVGVETELTYVLDVPGWYGNCRVFTGTCNGGFQKVTDEVQHACFVPMEKLDVIVQDFPFLMMAGFKHTLEHYLEYINK